MASIFFDLRDSQDQLCDGVVFEIYFGFNSSGTREVYTVKALA